MIPFFDSGFDSGFTPKFGQVCILPINAISPAPENDLIYHPASTSNPELHKLARDIKKRGILDPLKITLDHVILSGHRRYAAAGLVGLKELPCLYSDIHSADEEFLPLLRAHNLQREKTNDERLREELVSIDPEDAYARLLEEREANPNAEVETFALLDSKQRAKLTAAKQPFLEAAIRVLKELRAFRPLTVRQIHYQLLNNPPLMHATKPKSVYQNNRNCYQSLTDLLVRARLEKCIPFTWIADETRPVQLNQGHLTAASFLHDSLQTFLKGYRRNLQQNQPSHIEIIAEKNTLNSILQPIAHRYGVPMTTGRGYCSLHPRYEMAERFKKSGKKRLVLLIVSDFDPDGEMIARSFASSMRDDFDIDAIDPIKVALTHKQVLEMNLPEGLDARDKNGSRKNWFIEQYGSKTYELEALSPTTLQSLLSDAIESVLDTDAFHEQIRAEKDDAVFLEKNRRILSQYVRENAESEENSDLSGFWGVF